MGNRGGALIVALIAVAVLSTLAVSALTLNMAVSREVEADRNEARALHLAEAGLNEAVAMLTTTLTTKAAPATSLGTETAPNSMKSGQYWADVTDNGDGTFTITATGSVNGRTRRAQAIVRQVGGGVFDNAVFSGNSSGDPNYVMKVGGTGGQADQILGNIYSGGDVEITGDGNVTGKIQAFGTISGGTGDEGVTQPIMDVSSMNYETTADYDVAALFSAATWEDYSPGGSAWQLPEGNPAHIFRKNPDDRASENSRWTTDDYYMEDPYTVVRNDPNQDGTDAWQVSFSGDSGQDKVYFIDGNLWIHSSPTYSYGLVNDNGEPVRITIVVRGNITISDNIFYGDPTRDALMLMALKDPLQPDSGNIYFGDPSGGTLEYMDAFMYAENDFVDYNLSASGSKNVVLNGNMTAGNQVNIDRDVTNSDGTVSHSQLIVQFDDRIASGSLTLPGLPSWIGATGDFQVLAWREVTSTTGVDLFAPDSGGGANKLNFYQEP